MSYTVSGVNVTGWSDKTIIITKQLTDVDSGAVGATVIATNAFYNKGYTFNLSNLTFPTNLTTIGNNAYRNENGMTGSLILPDSLQIIGNNAFDKCTGFTGSLTIPSSVTRIGSFAFVNTQFSGHLDLSNLTLNPSIINNGSFRYCDFTSLDLPEVDNIGTESFQYTPLESVYFRSGCTLQNSSFSGNTTATVYVSSGSSFTVGITTGTFSPTVNPLSRFFSKWRLYNYPYPKTTSYYKQGVSSFNLQYNTIVPIKFYTYSPVFREDYVIKIDDVVQGPLLFSQTYNSTTKMTVIQGLTLMPAGAQELTIDDVGPMYLTQGLTVTQNDEEVAEVDVTVPFTLLPFAYPYVALFDGTATNLPEQQFNQCPFTIYENNVQIQGGTFLSEDLTLTPYFKESRMFARSIIYTLEPDLPVMVQLVDANTGLPMSEPVESTGSYYIGNLRDGSYYLRIVNDQLIYDHTIIADICFVKGTIVKTDQGLISIDKITNQTLNRKPITVTKTIHHDPYLVKVSAGAFGELPTRDTYMSLKHHIIMDVPVMAKNLINGDTITEVPCDDEYLYNVLVDTHTTMRVHGMLVETLDPNSIVGLFYRAKLSPKQKNKMIRMINEEPERAKMMLKVL